MFSIQKRFRMQPYFQHIDHPKTAQIDILRTRSENYIERVSSAVHKIYTLEEREDLSFTLIKYFGKYPVIRDFFQDHPTCWNDLIRKIHKHRRNDSDNGWHIPEQFIDDIYTTFLVRGRKNDIGKLLRASITEGVLKNEPLIEFASKQPSLLDTGWYSYSQLPKTRNKEIKIKDVNGVTPIMSWRRNTTEKLIKSSLIKNNSKCTEENIWEYFNAVFPDILHYLQSIYGFQVEEYRVCKNIVSLVNHIEKALDSEHGNKRENAFRIIQWFYAWSWLPEIIEAHKEALNVVDKFPDKLKKAFPGWKLENIRSRYESGVTIYMGELIYQWSTFQVSWRIKSIRSILQKLFTSEEYGSYDAIRDLFGGSLAWEDSYKEKEKQKDVIQKLMGLMADFWFIVKTKYLYSENDLDYIVKGSKKTPVYKTTATGTSTSAKKIRNLSISWYMSLGDIPLWSEFQVSSQSDMKKKKEDDGKYKSRDALDGMIRWAKFTTLSWCIQLLETQIGWEKTAETFKNAIIGWINNRFILPYVSHDGSIVLFTTPKHQTAFKEKFNASEKLYQCEPWSEHYQKMLNYIKQHIKKYMDEVSIS